MKSITSRIPTAVKRKIKTILRYPVPYRFFSAPSIQRQLMQFTYQGRGLEVEADHGSPLYETIAEVVDYDCYQLNQISGQNMGTFNILDVGANIGVTALVFSQLPKAKVICFEPFEPNCNWLQRNVDRNGITNVEVICSAIGTFNGRGKFYAQPDENVTGRLIKSSGFVSAGIIEVNVITLEDACSRFSGDKISLLKADCEGGEYGIIEQLTPQLASRIESITLEVHDQDGQCNCRMLSKNLEKLGYSIFYKPDIFERNGLHHVFATRRHT
jgi:FkbM family methyltransferase